MSAATTGTQQAPWPTLVPSSKAQNRLLEPAATHAVHVLDALLADTRRCPHFLHRSKAVVICTVYKAGFGLALEHGSGLLLARLPTSSTAMISVDAFASRAQHGWSAPVFVSVDGLSGGLTAGVQKADTIIGIMTDAALERIVSGGTIELGAGWGVSLLDFDSESTSSYHDLIVCPLASGLMLDASLSCCRLHINAGRTAIAYGEGVAARQLLYGDLPPPQAALPLLRRLSEAEGHALAAAFEPSVNSEKDAW